MCLKVDLCPSRIFLFQKLLFTSFLFDYFTVSGRREKQASNDLLLFLFAYS